MVKQREVFFGLPGAWKKYKKKQNARSLQQIIENGQIWVSRPRLVLILVVNQKKRPKKKSNMVTSSVVQKCGVAFRRFSIFREQITF